MQLVMLASRVSRCNARLRFNSLEVWTGNSKMPKPKVKCRFFRMSERNQFCWFVFWFFSIALAIFERECPMRESEDFCMSQLVVLDGAAVISSS